MNSIPKAAEPLIHEFADAFTRPTYRRFVVLLLAAMMTTGRRTVTNLLRTVSAMAPGHPSSYHRVLSRRR
ncbi:MAG: transposase [Candidatus Krumholzibacteria bacterium]